MGDEMNVQLEAEDVFSSAKFDQYNPSKKFKALEKAASL
jgi:hypothetical protein